MRFNSKSESAYRRQSYIDMCNKLGIEFPANAKTVTIGDLINDYKSEAVVVETAEGIRLRRTDKPVKEFTYSVTFNCNVDVKATSEEAAREWLEEQFVNVINDLYSGMSVDCPDLMECELMNEDEV